MYDDGRKIRPPLYMIGQKIFCWRCSSKMTIIALLAPNVDNTDNQICVLSGIEDIPQDILSFIQNRVPTFKLRYSKMAGKKYFANTCPKCGVISGEFFLHDEPGAPFFPSNEDEAKSLYMREIPLLKPIKIRTGLNFGVGDIILSNATKL